MNLFGKVKNIVLKEKLFKEKDKLIVGVSGGPDSVCLLDILVKIKKDFRLNLIVAHFNHGLRKEAEAEKKFVENLALSYGLKFISRRAKEKPKSNIEEWSRNQRYQFLGEIAFENKAKGVVVAHTADDQIETVLMNILRGCGLAGLCGMQYKSYFRINFKGEEKKFLLIRPFLDIWRWEIQEYLKEKNLHYIVDPSNFDLRFTRNKIRHQIIPALVRENPNFKEDFLQKIKEHQNQYTKFLEKLEKVFQKIIIEAERGKIKFDWEGFLGLSDFEKSEIIRLAIRKIKGDVFGFEKIHIDEILEVANKRYYGKKKIFKGLVFENQKDGFAIYKI